MTPAAFKRTLTASRPPAGVAPPLAALWWLAKGEWTTAHNLVQDEATREAAWVHAHLHRVEGDDANARYWYGQARRPAASASLDDEWNTICTCLLGKTAADG